MRLFGGKSDSSDEPNWPEHEARAGHLMRTVVPYGVLSFNRPADTTAWIEWREFAASGDVDAAKSCLLLMIRRVESEGGWSFDTIDRVKCLDTSELTVSVTDAVYALRTAVQAEDTIWGAPVLACAAELACRVDRPGDPALIPGRHNLVASVAQRRNLGASERSRIRRAIMRLGPLSGDDGAVDRSVILPADGWSAVVLAELATWTGTCQPVSEMLRHLAAATGSKPGKAWQAKAAQLLADSDAQRALRLLLEAVAYAEGRRVTAHFIGTASVLVSDQNADLLRGAAWAASAVEADWVVPALNQALRRSMSGNDYTGWVESQKVPNSCITSLGLIGSDEAIVALQQCYRETKHNGFRKQISASLAVAAARRGLRPGELAERVVATAGLAQPGERLIGSGTWPARIRITSDWKVATEWQGPQGWLRQAPQDTDEASGRAVKAAVREAKEALAGERSRLEDLLSEDRDWAVADWSTLYRDHPVTGTLSRALLWVFESASGSRSVGLPTVAGTLMTLTGEQDLPADGVVRLWHPARAGTDEVQAWRDFLVSREFRQPFKQAFREIYLLTPAEQETSTYSNRFAAHVLRYQQMFALMKERRWATNYLGPHDGGYEGRARRDFPDAGLTAVFDHYAADDHALDARIAHCATDRVIFHRTGDRTRTPVNLDDVPGLVFSEAMRDVDLFVSVTSIALDPQWYDRGEDPHFAYWQRHSFGELSQTGSVRRDALARILPKLKIADRLELADRHLRVRGTLHAYKIHLGSANILIEPDDRYLCIVPQSSRSKVMLPFDGDQLLSVILSKAVLLAADDKITDQTILRQLAVRPVAGAPES